jgi:tight adherence protein C
LTTQARLGARAMLLLTPGFWLLLVASDARHTLSSLSKSGPRTAIVLGVALQLLGGAWIGSIVRNAAGGPRERSLSNVPVLRALPALVGGRRRSGIGDEIAEASETIAFVLDAGRSPSGALEAVAPLVRGVFGERLARSVALTRAGTRTVDALRESASDLEDPMPRFVGAFDASMSLGVPLAPALRSLADDVRERTVVELNERVRGASVRVLVPLGLLILPAFVLSCLVPLFAGGLVGLSGP